MSTYLLLAIAIAFEIAATMGLKASDGFSRVGVTVLVVIGYVCSFALLGLALKQGLEVSVGYAVWSATGTAMVAVLGVLIYRETLSPLAVAGIAIVVIGVVLIHVGSPPAEADPQARVGAAPQ